MRSRPRVLVIYKRSVYDIYVRVRKHARVVELLEAGDVAVSRLTRAHEDHTETLRRARKVLRELGARATFRRRSEAEPDAHYDLVVTLGGDGTFLWASHMVGPRCPVLAINSAPKDSVGYFCAATKDDLGSVLADALAGRLSATRLTRMRVDIDDKPLFARVLNDVLFCHGVPAATSRYLLRFDGREEEQKSSGTWVATAAGSTAAIRSAGGSVQPISARRLQFRVREPYITPGAPYRLIKGFVSPGKKLEIVSQMRTGRLYIDGPRITHNIEIGSRLTVQTAGEPLLLLGFQGR